MKMVRKHPWLAIWLGFVLSALITLGMASPVWAGAFSVVPQLVQLGGDNRNATVQVRNTGDTVTIFQVETFAWVDSPALEALQPTRDVLASPAVFTLEPGERQTVRIAARLASDLLAVEQSYRLLVSEVPAEGGDGGVVFALRMNLPVFFTPNNARPALEARLGAGGRTVSLHNPGSAHLRVTEARLVEPASGQVVETLALQQPAYLLPGRRIDTPLAGNAAGFGLRLEADTTSGPIQTDLSE